MADAPRLSPFVRPSSGVERAAAAALGVAGVWLVLVAAYAVGWFSSEPAPGVERRTMLTALLFLLAALGPAALFAAAALVLRRAEAIRAETAALREALAGWRPGEGGGESESAGRAAAAAARAAMAESAAAAAARFDALDARLDAALAEIETLTGRRAARAPARPAPAPGQPGLPFESAEAAPEPAQAAQVTWRDLLRALDFPRSEDDAEAFAAIGSALRDPAFRELLQAAEDVLTILAAEGLHMEDLQAEPASPEAWRRYAEGARGAAAAVGGVRDEAALEIARARARRDPVFRDAGLVFARRWNALVGRVAREHGADPLLPKLADTRSGRAFQLVARALGAFD